MVKKTGSFGITATYTGEKGMERLVELKLTCGTKRVFEGERGAERLVSEELPWGKTRVFTEYTEYTQSAFVETDTNTAKKIARNV